MLLDLRQCLCFGVNAHRDVLWPIADGRRVAQMTQPDGEEDQLVECMVLKALLQHGSLRVHDSWWRVAHQC